MKDIYGQDEIERNSAVELPAGAPQDLGNTLMSWLGSFWREIHKDDRMIRGIQGMRGFVLAQMYLDLIEMFRLQDRQSAPVLHHELWYPFVIRMSQRDTSQENLLAMGANDMVIGAQGPGSIYGEGTVLHVGKLGGFEKYVTYPILGGDDIRHMAATISDNPLNPSLTLVSGEGFEFRNGSIIFPKELDPFGEDSPFYAYDIPGEDPEHPEEGDRETVLWASDVLLDRNFVADYLSYPIGAAAPSLAEVKRIVNAAWDAICDGLTPDACSRLIAAMLNVPAIQDKEETVLNIAIDGSTGDKLVTTDKRTYRVVARATLRKYVKSGAKLHKGQLLDESARIYPMLTNPDPEHVAGITGFSVPVDQDVPSITMPPQLLKVGTQYGIYATWGAVKVEQDALRPLDAHGNPRLYFDIGGQPGDVRAFWEGVWAESEAKAVNLEGIMGEKGSDISPAQFFLRNLVGANTLVVTIDRSQVEDISMMRNPMFFGMLSRVVPSATRLFFIEHRSVSGEDEADMGDAGEDTFLAASMRPDPDMVECSLDGAGPSYGDTVLARLIRPAPRRTRG